MNLTELITSAELRFRQILEDYFESVYNERNLHSHGLIHHRRVWCYAKEILSLPHITDSSSLSCDPEKLILACYLHDIGMSADPGPRHGKKSRELCQKFLKNCNLNLNNYRDLLETIENHDNKDYLTDIPGNSLLRILSLADDLDAFGCIGIYRYCEIYLKRGITLSVIGYLIRENAAVRFNYFKKVLSADDDYVSKHKTRFEILDNFFINYNKQARAYDFTSDTPSGYCGVAQLFKLMSGMNLSLEDLFTDSARYSHDSIISMFIKGIQTEFSPDNQDY